MDAIDRAIAPPIASTREIDGLIAQLAARQHDRVARWQLLQMGISKEAIDHRLETERLRKVRTGVYRLGTGRPTRRARWMTDVLACGEGAGLGGRSVLELLDVRRPSNRRTVVITSKRGRRKPKDIDLRTSRDVEFIEWDGIPITPLPRALADAAPDLDDEQLEAAYEKALTKWNLPPSLIPRRNKRLNRLIDHHAMATALTDSDLENRFRRILKRAGLPQPVSNRPLCARGVWYRPDFLWPEQRLVAEVDGDIHVEQTSADRRREADLSAEGLIVQRFCRLQIIRHQQDIVAALRPFL